MTGAAVNDAGLPAEITAARGEVTRALATVGSPWVPSPVAVPTTPVVALVGAPGRGRRALAAALVDRDPAVVGPTTTRLTGGAPHHDDPGALAVPVPLLDELDLTLPAPWPAPAGPASMLLVVVSAGSPVDAAELDALARAAGAVDLVAFALVGTEAHRGWRTVLEADRDLVAARLPRLAGAEWFPVSPVLAAQARGTGAAGAPLRLRSGVAPLQRRLHGLVARRRRMLAEANVLRAAVTALTTTLTTATERDPDDLGAGGPPVPAPRAPESDGAARRARHVRWRSDLAGARLAAVDDLTRRFRAVAAVHRTRIDRAGRRELDALPAAVAHDLEEAAREVVAGLGDRLRALVEAALAELVPAAELARLRIPPPAARPDLPGPEPRRPDRLLVVAGASGGLGLTRLALLPLLAVPAASFVGTALVPVTIGVGLGAAGAVAVARRRALDRARARAWLAEAVAQARNDLERLLAEALVVADREITLALDRALDVVPRTRGPGAGPDGSALARHHAQAEHARVVVRRAEAVLARLALVRDA